MKFNALTQMFAKKVAAGRYADGQGPWLHKRTAESDKWVQRLYIGRKRRDMGLGRWPDVSIAEAREKAALARKSLRDGVDPIQAKQAASQRVRRLTVSEAIEDCFKSRQAELKGAGKAGRWMSPLSVHAIPKIGNKAIEDIDQHELKRLLRNCRSVNFEDTTYSDGTASPTASRILWLEHASGGQSRERSCDPLHTDTQKRECGPASHPSLRI